MDGRGKMFLTLDGSGSGNHGLGMSRVGLGLSCPTYSSFRRGITNNQTSKALFGQIIINPFSEAQGSRRDFRTLPITQGSQDL